MNAPSQRVLALIPARGESKGIPDKNILPMAGISLVERAFRCAQSAGICDRIILSTDSERIAQSATRIGLDWLMRPNILATDTAPMIDVVLHAVEALESKGDFYDVVLLLQPTSPLRRPEHLCQALALLENGDAVCSVVALPTTHSPHYVMKIRDSYLESFLPEGVNVNRRQDAPVAYKRDGTVYLTRIATLHSMRSLYGSRCVPLILETHETISIDETADWDAAAKLLTLRGKAEERRTHLSVFSEPPNSV